jgi:cytochrome d ubiquinol oxidase subunit II
VFAIASVITPLFLGICVGTIASGALRDVAPGAGAYEAYVAPWLSPFPLACGVLTLVVFAFLAAVYLTVEAESDALREDFRRRALWSAGAMFVAAFGALWVSHTSAPQLRHALTATVWAAPLQIGTGVAAIVAIVSLWKRRWRVARVAAVLQVTGILWGWGASQYPDLVPQRLSIAAAAAPSATLRLTLIVLAGGGVILIPSLWYLFRVFKSNRHSPSV